MLTISLSRFVFCKAQSVTDLNVSRLLAHESLAKPKPDFHHALSRNRAGLREGRERRALARLTRLRHPPIPECCSRPCIRRRQEEQRAVASLSAGEATRIRTRRAGGGCWLGGNGPGCCPSDRSRRSRPSLVSKCAVVRSCWCSSFICHAVVGLVGLPIRTCNRSHWQRTRARDSSKCSPKHHLFKVLSS